MQHNQRPSPHLAAEASPKNVQPQVAIGRGAFAEAIAAATDELGVEIAASPDQVLEAQRLRYRSSGEERKFEIGKDGLEQDEFDPASRHVLARSRRTGAVMGAVRVVLSDIGQDGFPMRRACDAELFDTVPLKSTGEISRFAVARQRLGLSSAAGALVRLSLISGLVQVSAQEGLTHWCMLTEPVLLRLLQATAIHFEPVGPVVDCDGPRQLAVCAIGPMLKRMRLEQPAIWAYITGCGALWPEGPTNAWSPS